MEAGAAMVRIVDIERRGTIWTIRFESEPQLRCSRAFARRLRLDAGQEIDPALLERVRETAAVDLADRLVERILRRPHSRREIAARLHQEGVPETAVRATLERLMQDAEHDEGGDALELARRCVPQGGQDWNEVRRKCGQRLQRRGFSAATALRAVQTAWQEAQQPQRSPARPRYAPDDIPDNIPDDIPDESVGSANGSAKFRSRVP